MKILLATLSLLLAFALGGCTTTGGTSSVSPETKNLLVNATIVYATAKVLENNPGYAPRVAEIAASVRAATAGDVVAATVDALMEVANSKINWRKLADSPADYSLVKLLLDTIRIELTNRLGSAPLPPDKLLKVAEVAALIEATARAQIPKTP